MNLDDRPTPETDDNEFALIGTDYAAVKSDFARRLKRQLDEAQADLTAMREAVKEVTAILAKIPDAYDSRFFRAGQWADAVLTRLQPFIK